MSIRWKLRLGALLLSLVIAFAIMAWRFHGHNVVAGDLVISHARTVATAPGAPVAGGYMAIKNNSDQIENLLGASASFSGKVSIHETTMDQGVMKMRALVGGIEIPAGQSVELTPQGYHLMFTELKKSLDAEQSANVVLHFELAGDVEVPLTITEDAADTHAGH